MVPGMVILAGGSAQNNSARFCQIPQEWPDSSRNHRDMIKTSMCCHLHDLGTYLFYCLFCIFQAVDPIYFLSFYSVVYSIYVETMYCSYSSVCPVGTTGNLIFYLVFLIWFQHFHYNGNKSTNASSMNFNQISNFKMQMYHRDCTIGDSKHQWSTAVRLISFHFPSLTDKLFISDPISFSKNLNVFHTCFIIHSLNLDWDKKFLFHVGWYEIVF